MPIPRKPSILTLKINEECVDFEVDTGSHVSTLRHCDATRLCANITPTQHRILGYGGAQVKLCGEASVTISCKGRTITHTILIVNSGNANLLGRDLCDKFGICLEVPTSNDCKGSVNAIRDCSNVKNSILNEFQDYLSGSFKSCVKQTVSLKVLPNAQPVFARARPVPVRMRDEVRNELDKLTETGRITKVFSSDWASPTVNVLKNDRTVRICGDYSVSINAFLDPV